MPATHRNLTVFDEAAPGKPLLDRLSRFTWGLVVPWLAMAALLHFAVLTPWQDCIRRMEELEARQRRQQGVAEKQQQVREGVQKRMLRDEADLMVLQQDNLLLAKQVGNELRKGGD